MQLQDKIALIQFSPDDVHQHVAVLKEEQCSECQEKPCLSICPTGVFKWDYQQGNPLQVYYKQCVECGACRLVCQFDNIRFTYPSNGLGVAYREG